MKPIPPRSAVLLLGLLTLLLGLTSPAVAELNRFKLTVSVRYANGQPVPGAAVTITHDRLGPDVRPFDYRMETDPSGTAATDIVPNGWGEGTAYWPTLQIEAKKGPRVAHATVKVTGERLTSGVRYADVAKTLVIEGDEETERTKINLAVSLTSDDPGAVASVPISVRGPEGTYTGRTGPDGRANIAVPWIARGEYWVSANKRGFESKERLVALDASPSNAVDAPITLTKSAHADGVIVTINVKRAGSPEGVREAHLKIRDLSKAVSDDYYKTTNTAGVAVIRLPGPGNYPITIEQDTFEPYSGQLQIAAGEETKTFDFTLKEKGEGEETVTVTVLAGDTKNGRGSFEPIRGATVTAGAASGNTDGNGQVTLTVKSGIAETDKGVGYAEAVEVKVSASNYKSQTRSVQLKRTRHRNLPGSAEATFTLERGEDEAADDTPIKLVVEVRDPLGPVPLAAVTTPIGSGDTDRKGERDFNSGNRKGEALAALRAGMKVQVAHPGHKTSESTIPAELLKPSNETRRYAVTLEMDWSELTRAIQSLEERVNAWKSEARAIGGKGKTVEDLAAKCAAARGRGETLLIEMRNARKVFDSKSDAPCKEAAELEKTINELREKSQDKEKELRSTLDEAIGLAAACKTKAEGALIATKHGNAIKLTGELGQLEKQAQAANQKRESLAQALPDFGPAKAKLRETADQIEAEISAAGKAAAEASNDIDELERTGKALPGRRAELLRAFDEMRTWNHVREYDSVLPNDLRTRVQNLDAVLAPAGTDVSMSFVPTIDRSRIKTLSETVSKLQEYKNEADGIVSAVQGAVCEIKPVDYMIKGIGATVVGASIELAAAADLPAKAQACGAASSPTPDDEITVPDVSGFDDPGAMKAAAGPDMVGAIVATKEKPPAGTTRLFAHQDPPAGSKAKRNSTLKIFIYQSLAVAATPTPSPSPSDEITVPDVSGFTDVKAMKAAAGPDMVGKIVAVKDTPPDGQTSPFFNQLPKAGTKAKRGDPLTIFVYQSMLQAATPTPSPTATPARAIAMPGLIGLTLDQAVSRLPSNMRIGSDEVGDAPPSPELALTIFYQSPAAGSAVDATGSVVITVKRYGSAKSTTVERFDGTYVGSYRGADKGKVRFTVSGGTITISSPGSGSGQLSASGSARISGSGRDGNSSYSFTGTFSVDANGKATASGSWSGTQSGYHGSGTWSAARP